MHLDERECTHRDQIWRYRVYTATYSFVFRMSDGRSLTGRSEIPRSLEIGKNISARMIRNESDVFLSCKVEALLVLRNLRRVHLYDTHLITPFYAVVSYLLDIQWTRSRRADNLARNSQESIKSRGLMGTFYRRNLAFFIPSSKFQIGIVSVEFDETFEKD